MHHSRVTNTLWGPYNGCSILLSCFTIEADGHRMSCQKMFMHIMMYAYFTSTYTAMSSCPILDSTCHDAP